MLPVRSTGKKEGPFWTIVGSDRFSPRFGSAIEPSRKACSVPSEIFPIVAQEMQALRCAADDAKEPDGSRSNAKIGPKFEHGKLV